jgi:hypothetical protein
MITPVSMTEQLLFMTVRIETKAASGELGVGTGFFFNFRVDERSHVPVIVTNKHVVRGAIEGTFQIHQARGNAPSVTTTTFQFQNFEQEWHPHPDPDVDLCALPIGPIISTASKDGCPLFYRCMDESFILSQHELEELTAMQSVAMVGYPKGLSDTVNNLPLLRRGVTATHPAIDFCGKPLTAIDMACFPGSSGSPVLLLDEGMIIDRRGDVQAGRSRMRLIGVLHAGPIMTQDGEIIVEEAPTTLVPKARTSLMIHLGYVIKARELIRLGQNLADYVAEQLAGSPRDESLTPPGRE